MSKLVLLVTLLAVTGCDNEPTSPTAAGYKCERYGGRNCVIGYQYKMVCDQESRAKFIIDCSKAANPMSDEEGEDLVKQCSWTSQDLFCTKEFKGAR